MSLRRSARLAKAASRAQGKTDEQSRTGDPNQFKPFPSLPAELRHEIWRMVAAETPVSSVCILTLVSSDSPRGQKHEPLVVHEPRNKALMSTSHESREITLKVHPTRKYNPETDILYLNTEGFRYFTDNLLGRCHLPWANKVRHLAINMSTASIGALALPHAMEYLTSLQTLSVVYPKASGQVDCFAEVPLPKEPGAALRQFTEEEMKNFTITANYTYDTWHSAIPIKWKASAEDHLKSEEVSLNHQCSPGNASQVPKIWDHDNKRLRLTYKALCFAS
ncbi:hypothetical protein GQ53DRAFT_820898 [Thozetella sp. PMI_491]|nr:hypothetical protein GQ53DRAFT_820898 [Thozetella sp. PMI_491]